MPSDPLSLRTGQSLGRYEILAPVARGGMGQVWAGRLRGARGFQKLVAIKTLLPSRTGEDDRMERMLLEEARIAALIQHSNVVQTMELGEHEGALYLVMEWVDGEPLSYLLSCAERSGGVPLSVAVNLVAQTLQGLHAAHELADETGALLGVVHRDVSPHNVLVTYAGVAKLVDFGIAKAMNQISSSTETGEVKGKFSYMAPEQILGGDVDRRADLFAVGIMLYLLTTGQHPFENHDSAGVIHSITNEEPATRPSLFRTSYSRMLEAVVMKALDKDRDARWSTAEEMRSALQRAVPQAFGLGCEARMRGFMADLVGERSAHKREALRRAELAADTHLKDSGSLAVASSTAQSASSLRAISVDKSEREPQEEPVARPSRMPTFRPAPPAQAALPRTRRAWLVGAAAIGALAAGFVLVHVSGVARHAAASPSAGMVELAPPSPSPSSRLPASASAVPEALSAAPSVAVPPSLAPSTSVAPPLPAQRVPPIRRPAVPPPSSKAPRAGSAVAHSKSDDLIAPDYAR